METGDKARPRVSLWRQLAAVVVIIGGGVLAWVLLGDNGWLTADDAPDAVPAGEAPAGSTVGAGEGVIVITRAAASSSNDRVFEAVGTGQALKSITIFPAVAEQVAEITFTAGKAVEAGEVLVRLDSDEERLAVELARVELEDARRLLGRYERAIGTGGVPASEVDAARAAVDSAGIALEQAQVALEQRVVRAPFAGIVGIPGVDPGERVTTTTILTTLDDRSAILVDFDVPEVLAAAVREGQTVDARTWALPDHGFEGVIDAVQSRIDTETRTLRVRARIENEADLLRPGMSFAVRLEQPGQDYPSVPEIAVQWGRQGSLVWVAREGKAEQVPVRVVARNGGQVLVDGELAAGEDVIVEGFQRLRPGRAVQVLERRAPDDGASVDDAAPAVRAPAEG